MNRRLAFLLVTVLAAAVYLNSLDNGFALDDRPVVAFNTHVHGLEKLGEALTGPYWPIRPASHGMYRPLTSATFAVDWEIWGGQPVGFHLSNIALHVLVTALVFLLLLALGAGVPAAAAAGAVFAVHPVHVEAVANVVGRGELLSALFFIAATLVYTRRARADEGRGWGTAAAVGSLYFLSLAAKEMGATLPALLVLMHVATEADLRAAFRAALDRWRVFAASGVAFAVYMALRWVNIQTLTAGAGGAPWFYQEPGIARLLTAIRVWPEYLRLSFVPIDLVADYGPGVIVPVTTWLDPLVLLGLATAMGVTAAAVLAWRKARLLSIGVLWFAITILPVSNLPFATGVLLAERSLYLPSVGIAMAVAAVAEIVRLGAPLRLRAAVAVLVALVAAGAARTWVRNPVWEDTNTVIDSMIRDHPANYRAQWAMAQIRMARGDTAAALAHLQLSVLMVPGHHSARVTYGNALLAARQYEAAAAQFDTARTLVPEIQGPHVQYLRSLILAGDTRAALAVGADLVRQFPENPNMYHHLARALAREGRFEEAVGARHRALALAPPDSTRAAQFVHLATLELASGHEEEAAVALDSARASHRHPDDVPGLETLQDRLAEGQEEWIPYW
jgi:hypothetical protein